MKYFELADAHGQSMKISKIILGGAPLGTKVSRELSFEVLDKYLEHGGNTIDTARIYCDWLEGGHGKSEQTIGEWVKARGNQRDIVLITKGGHISEDGAPRLSREEIFGDMDSSLQTLQMDYVDLYLLHRDDVNRPVEDIVDSLHILVEQGKTRAVGVSNWSIDRILAANAYAREHNKTQLCTSEIQWSLAECRPETYDDETLICMTKELHQKYLEIGIPVLAFSSQANGLFSRAGDGLENVGSGMQKFVTPENIRRYGKLLRFCRKSGYSKTAVSLSYIIDNPLKAAAIIGCSNLHQLEDSLSAADITLTPDEIDNLTR